MQGSRRTQWTPGVSPPILFAIPEHRSGKILSEQFFSTGETWEHIAVARFVAGKQSQISRPELNCIPEITVPCMRFGNKVDFNR